MALEELSKVSKYNADDVIVLALRLSKLGPALSKYITEKVRRIKDVGVNKPRRP